MSYYLGELELSVVPKSLFSGDGSLYKTTDKAVLASEMKKLISDENVLNLTEEDTIDNKVIAFFMVWR
jgi:hypothetical protein